MYRRLSQVAEYLSIGYVEDVEQAVSKVESLPSAALPKNPTDLDTVVMLRGYVPPAYWAELWRSKAAADFVPMLALIQAAGAKPILNRALSIIRAEMPRVEKELKLIAAMTTFSSRECIAELVHADDENYLRGRVYGEASSSLYFGEKALRKVIDYFG